MNPELQHWLTARGAQLLTKTAFDGGIQLDYYLIEGKAVLIAYYLTTPQAWAAFTADPHLDSTSQLADVERRLHLRPLPR